MRYSELFVESRRFPPPTRHLALCLVVTPGRSNFIKVFGVRKLEPLGYHYHVTLLALRISAILRLDILAEHRLVTDTDRHATTTYTVRSELAR